MDKNKIGIVNLFTGVLLIGLGILSFVQPRDELLTLAFYLGIAFLCSGGIKLTSIVTSKYSNCLFSLGLLDIFIGIIFIGDIGITLITFPIIFAFWTLFTGITRFTMIPQLYKEGAVYWKWEASAGIIGIIFSFLLLTNPIVGFFPLIAMISITLISYGLIDIGEYIATRYE